MVFQPVQLIRNIVQQRKTTTAAINSVLGKEGILRRRVDIASFEGISEIFNKRLKLYRTVDPQTGKTIKNIGCHYNDSREIESMFVLNRAEGNVDVFTKSGEIIRSYTGGEATALFTYKHNSKDIHGVLRGTKKVKNEDEIRKHITFIENLFKEGKNVSIAEENIVAYRALDKTSLKQILSMQEGEIFTDPSFVSVATKKRKIYPFFNLKNFRHPLKVTIPKGEKYISLDELHNIVCPNNPETELLLKGSFEIIKKPKYGPIEVIYKGL